MRRIRLLALSCLLFSTSLVSAPAGAANKAPKIVKARMVDTDGDQAANRVVLTYSEPIRHRRDADGRYPFEVKGFEIRAIRAAKGTKKLVILLKEHVRSDVGRTPTIAYRRTKKDPVRDRSGTQAAAQTFARVVALAAPVPTETEALLSVTSSGPGTVTSEPEGVSCPSTCDVLFAKDSVVVLTATPDDTVEGAFFAGWGGACGGSSSTCVLTLDADTEVTAEFDHPDPEPEASPSDGPLPLPSLDPDPLPTDDPAPLPTLGV